MNHGRCFKCCWYQVLKSESYKIDDLGKLEKIKGNGVCWMETAIGCNFEERIIVDSDSYCPDYCNRNRMDAINLKEWLAKNNIK